MPTGQTPTPPQETPARKGPLCAKCKSTGRQTCPEHDKEKDVLAYEDDVWFCSDLADCATCGGTGFIGCPFCDNPEPEQELEARKKRIQAEKPILEKYDADMGRKLRKCSNEHYTLVWEIDSMKVDKRQCAGHELMHIYLQRLEQTYKDYTQVLKVKPTEFAQRARIFVWWTVSDQKNASLRFAQEGAERGMKLMGSSIAYSVCGNKQFFVTDAQLARNLAHCVGHLWFSHQEPSQWVGNKKGGWAEEGLAHWFEDRYFGICDTYCYEEQNTMVYFKGGKYRVALRKMVAEEQVPPVSEVLQLNSDQLTPAQHAVSFGIVDYLIHLDGAKFNAVGRMLRQQVNSRDALAKAYELSPLALEAAWKAWVLETYPKQ
jgi:hypothetical protein